MAKTCFMDRMATFVALAQLSHRRKNALLERRVELHAGELERLQRAFARFAPAELVERIAGDGLMSVFGALQRNPWHVQDAVEAAVAMRRALAGYNRRLS